MQVNRLSPRLQDELRSASGYNSERTETLFSEMGSDNTDAGFLNLNVEDLNISEYQIGALLGSFADEIIQIFGSQFAPFVQAQQKETSESKYESNTSDNSSPTTFIA